MKHLPRVPAKIFDGFLRSLQIDEHDLEQLAKQSGWHKREPRKITAAGLLTALCLESVQGDANFNDQARTPVRLVSAPVDKETAAHRRRKAKKEMHGHKPSAEVLALMDWAIFLTPLPQEGGDFKILFKLYGLRWRIEIIFKTWKSHLNFDSLHRVSEVELKTLLTARLLLITEGTNVLYRRCFLKIRELYDRDFKPPEIPQKAVPYARALRGDLPSLREPILRAPASLRASFALLLLRQADTKKLLRSMP